MKFLLRLLVLLWAVAGAQAEPLVIPLWPEGVPNLKTNTAPEIESEGRFTHVQHPTLTMYAPEIARSAGVAVIVAPGGGYARVGDGKSDARWLNSLGITAFVLKYRLEDYGHPAPLQDMLRAIRIVRAHAAEYGVRSDRIGVLGSSAGGHLAACAATLWDSPLGKTGAPLDQVSARPNFAALIYPVVTMEDPFVHKGSRRALFGRAPTSEQIESLSLEKQVRTNSPPSFLVATMADQSVPVENSLKLYQALRNAGVPAELHAYAAGAHGKSRDPQYGPTAEWPKRLEEWLRFNQWLPPEHRNYARWENEIAALVAAGTSNPPPKDATLFIGSSTIRLWKTLAQDFPGQPVINRGFGGSFVEDSTHFADRLVFPYAPRRIVFRAGGNDINDGKSPAQVLADFKAFVTVVHTKLPNTEIYFLAWNATPSRPASKTREHVLNQLVADYARTNPKVHYVDAEDISLDAQGQPRRELFVKDGIHFNAEGYRLLAERVRRDLQP